MKARHTAGHDHAPTGRMLDEIEAGAVLDGLNIARVASVALDVKIAHAPLLPFPFPVAVKLLAAEIAHKSDIGGVVLGVADGPGLLAAIRQIRATVGRHLPGGAVDNVVVQPMVSGLGEVLIGYRVDRDVGPLVLVAAGGIFTEIYRDRSFRLAPVDLETAREMIDEVRGFATLRGWRGKPAGDLDAVAQALVALSRLADEPAVAEAEINPLIVRSDGVVAVDALVKLTATA